MKNVLFSIVAVILLASGSSAFYGASPTVNFAETRCGWFVNPTPANAWLIDAKDEWIIAVQGGHQAEGDWPTFKNSQWVKMNNNYGYGCACMRLTTDIESRATRIHSGYAKPLSSCRKDKAIKDKEPRN